MTDLDERIAQMAHLVGAPCTLEDPEFRLIGFSHQLVAVDDVRQRSILERGSTVEVRDWFNAFGIAAAPGPVRTPADAERGIEARLCIPVRHLGRLYGYFWFLDPDGRIPEAVLGGAWQLAETTAALLDLAESRQARRDALYREVVEGGRTTAQHAANALASGAGIELTEPVRCILVERPELAEQLPSRPSRSGVVWTRERDGLVAATVRAALVAPSLECDGGGNVLDRLGITRGDADLDRHTMLAIGPEVPRLDALDRSRAGALVALRVAHSRAVSSVWWESLGVLQLLAVARDDDLRWATTPDAIARFASSATAELRATAIVFLDEAGSIARTAQRLGVHRQTVYHRLSQVETVTGTDLSRGEDRLRLHLALLLSPYVTAP